MKKWRESEWVWGGMIGLAVICAILSIFAKTPLQLGLLALLIPSCLLGGMLLRGFADQMENPDWSEKLVRKVVEPEIEEVNEHMDWGIWLVGLFPIMIICYKLTSMWATPEQFKNLSMFIPLLIILGWSLAVYVTHCVSKSVSKKTKKTREAV